MIAESCKLAATQMWISLWISYNTDDEKKKSNYKKCYLKQQPVPTHSVNDKKRLTMQIFPHEKRKETEKENRESELVWTRSK